jgi:predicted ATPase
LSQKDFSLSEFAGYSLSPLREDAPFKLYRARRHDNPLPVLVVALTAEQPSQESFRRLENEYSLASKLDATWSARPLELTRWEGRPILILADQGGEPLELILERRKSEELNLTEALRIAAGLARAVSQVHRQGLIHKDISPKNILVNEAGEVWPTGFGIASQLSNERQPSSPPEIIAGTLAYMAPEQTGRMNRSIDARSDLYSLGVTLYRMLTGRLPFAATDAMEWVHCHIAREPAPAHSICDLPVPLSYVVMRLLAKTAEDRYQTAAGLETDLLHCLTQWEMHGRIDSFALRTCAVAERLLIPEKLYGRESELSTLKAAFSRVVASGSPELVLVSGYDGVGKSSLVNELQKVLVAPGGLFAVGKFDQYKRDIPYATVVQAFHGLVRQILVKGKEEVDHLRSVLSEALGSNGQLLIDLIPEIEFIIGEQSPVSELPPKQSKNRFQLMLRRLLGAFATREHPLVLFLDDLQWQDGATLEFLEHLLTHSEVRHLLLIGAYRDNEIDSSSQLSRTIQAIRSTDAKVVEIVLSPLEIGHVDRLISDALHCTPSSAYPLAQLIREKTSGNPFFAIQFFTSLADEGLLSLDQVTRTWQWNMDRIRAKEYSDNVVDLMSGKIGRLSVGTQDILKELASLGSVVQLTTLALVRGESEEAMETSLNEAVRAGLIFSEERRYRFLRDRIQQAAYSLVPEERRAEVHLRIGRTLLSGLKENQLSEHLFDVASQLNRGSKGLTQRNEKIRVASINLRAGRKASAAAAYASARAYFTAGMELFEEEDWAAHYEPMFSLWLECARAHLLSGNFEECKQLTEKLLPRATSKADQGAVCQLKIQSHTLKSENDQAVATAIAYLRLLGIDLPVHPSGEILQAEPDGVLQSLAGRLPESLIDQQLIIDQDMQAAMQVLSSLIPAAFSTDFRLWCVLVSRMVKIGIQYGTSGAAAHAYGDWGCVLGHFFNNYPEGDRFGKLACNLIEKYGFIAHRAEVYYSMASLALFKHPVATALGYFRTAVYAGIETGDLGFSCYGKHQIITTLLLRNDPLDDVWRESEAALHFVREAQYDDILNIIDCQLRFIATMQGNTADVFAHSDVHFDEAKFESERQIAFDDLLVLDLKAESAVLVERAGRETRSSCRSE